MRSLIVIPFVPASNAPQAGHRLAFEAIKRQIARGETHVLLLLKHVEVLSEELLGLCGPTRITVVPVSRWAFLTAWLSMPWLYPRFLTRCSNNALRVIQRTLTTSSFETLRLEFSQTFIYAERLKRIGVVLPHIVLVTHDLQTQVVSRKDGWEYWALPWVLRTERRLSAAGDEMVVLSDKDKVLAASLLGFAGPLHTESPELSAFTRNFRRDPARVENNALLFWGAMGRPENEDAVLRFSSDVLEPLRREGKGFKLYIVGSAPSPRLLKLAGPDCVVTGFVDDPTPYFERCAIGVVPLLRGAGIKLKTLEMLACGMKVVATPVGAEGIEVDPEQMVVSPLSGFKAILAALHVGD